MAGDWEEVAFERVRQWARQSSLTLIDAFCSNAKPSARLAAAGAVGSAQLAMDRAEFHRAMQQSLAPGAPAYSLWQLDHLMRFVVGHCTRKPQSRLCVCTRCILLCQLRFDEIDCGLLVECHRVGVSGSSHSRRG